MKHYLSAVALALTASCAPVTAPVAIVQPVDQGATIAARQAAFQLSAVVAGGMKAAVERGQPAKSQAFAAKALAKWADALPLMFPAGSLGADSRAKPDIWLNRGDFDAKAASYAASAHALAGAAEANDAAAFATQLAATQQSCGACHSAYRAEARRR
jgi:cytochrome c556